MGIDWGTALALLACSGPFWFVIWVVISNQLKLRNEAAWERSHPSPGMTMEQFLQLHHGYRPGEEREMRRKRREEEEEDDDQAAVDMAFDEESEESKLIF